MHSAIDELKTCADLVLTRARSGDSLALNRFRKLPPFKGQPDQDLQTQLQHKHGLWLVALEQGFPTWKQAKAIISGECGNGDYGTMLYPCGATRFLNQWFASYEEARDQLQKQGGFLLAYRRQFLLVGVGYILYLGLDPADPDWKAIQHDWMNPKNREARSRLYAKLVCRKAATNNTKAG